MENNDRILVAIIDEDGDIVNKLLLTEDQMRLVDWLMENEYINRACHNFQAIADTDIPITI